MCYTYSVHWVVLLLTVVGSACGSTPAPTTPSPTPSPTPTPVLPTNYTGTWAGTYTVTTCDQAGDIAKAHWCEQLRAVPTPGLRLQVTQTDRTISALLFLGADSGTIAGQVGADNRLTLGGEYANTRDGYVILTTVGGWDTALSDPTHMVGHFAASQRVATFTGNMYFEGTLAVFTR